MEYPTCIHEDVRVRIVRPLTGVIDGIPLSSLVPKFVYDLKAEVAAHLIEMRGAVATGITEPTTIEPLEDVDPAWLTGGVRVLQRETAHDRPPRRRSSRRPSSDRTRKTTR
jgi:hypothetical protein